MKKYQNSIAKFIFFCIIFGGIFSVFDYAFAACQEHNVWGWAWSGNIGWISFSCRDRWGVGQGINYGVNVDPETGRLSGYAWSANVGWIWFAPTGTTPDGTVNPARINMATNEVFGWARAVVGGAPEAGGWDGWIKLRGPNYGVRIDASVSPAELRGWAWGGDPQGSPEAVIGWVSFNRLNCDSNRDGISDRGNYNQCPLGQTVSNYKVFVNIVPAPTVSNLTSNYLNPCAQSRIPTLSWNTSAVMPYDYELQICTNPDCSGVGNLLVSRLISDINSTSWSPICYRCCNIAPYNSVSFGGLTYHWRVRARNSGGSWGSWVSSSFVTKNHCYPRPDFLCNNTDCSGFTAFADEEVVLRNNSTIDGGAGVPSCSWVLPPGATIISGSLNDCLLTVKFSAGQNQRIRFTVTDTIGYSCSAEETINVFRPQLRWREIPPF